MRFLKTYILVSFALMLCSCIEYDMSYPRTLAEFTAFEAEGAENVVIDPLSRTVTLELDEASNLSAVKVKSYTLNDKAFVRDGDFPQVLDLTSDFQVVLSMYQDYEWTIKGVQHVERYVKCANQVGAASFDPQRCEAYIYVSMSQRLKYLTIDSMKLELDGSQVLTTTGYETIDNISTQVTRDCAFPMILDCTNARVFEVKTRDGQVKEWTLTAIPVEISAQITDVFAWTWSADIYATYDGTSEPPVITYKKVSDQEWLSVPEENIVIEGINYNAHLNGLDESTEYEVKFYFNGEELPGATFTTGAPAQLPNFNFDQWWSSNNGSLWYPNAEDALDVIWDSANAGTASFGLGSSTVPETEDVKSGKAVKMTSRYVAVKFAAGNIFTGKFNSVIGTSGADLDWGVPFSSRPKALKGWYKYSPALVNYIDNKKVNDSKEYDQGQLQVILIDTDCPYRVLPVKTGGITTNGPTYKDETKIIDLETDETIVARGVVNLGISDPDGDGEADWVEFELPIEYRDGRTPKYVIVTAASSYLGDYFTGGHGSVLMIDEFEFVYE